MPSERLGTRDMDEERLRDQAAIYPHTKTQYGKTEQAGSIRKQETGRH